MENLGKRTGRRWTDLLSRISILALLLSSTPRVSSYGSGAPTAVCDSMVPNHGAEPQTSPSPYKLILSKTSVQGTETVDITITSHSGDDTFKGFLLHVRKPGENKKAFGEFNEVIETNNGQALPCFDTPRSAVTHTSGDDKKIVKVQWIAPNDEDGEYEIFYTVVGKSYDKYWTHQRHEEKIRVTRNALAVTAPTVQAASEQLLKLWREVYTGCGETKGCFGMPGSCVQNFDVKSENPKPCDMMVTWSNKGGVAYEYQVTGKPGGAAMGYVAVALSNDASMGEDSVAGCAFKGSGKNPVAERYLNPAKSNNKHSDAKLGIDQTFSSNTDGHLFCYFTQKNHKVGNVDINLKDKSYYLLLARSASVLENGLGFHSGVSDKGASPRSVHISENIIMGASSNIVLVQLHGGLMIIAWLLCASTGMFTARYYKLTHTEFMPFGKAFWFALHVFCMAATAFLTIAGAIIIIVKKNGFELRDWHPILGIIVVGLAIVQVLIAFFRPHPGTPKRPFFNWVHWGIGNTAHIIGIVCIFLAWDLSLADLQRFSDKYLWMWIMLALVLFHVLMHIVMSIHTLWADKQMDSNNKKRAMQPGPMKPNGLNSEAPGTGFRTFMLSLYLLVMAAGAITLTVIVFWPKESNEEEATS